MPHRGHASCANQRMSGAIFRHRVVKKEVERALYTLTRWQLRRAREKIRYRNPQRCGCVDIPTRKVWTRRRATLAPDSRHIVAFHSSSTTSRAADSQFLRQLSVGSARRVNMCCPDRWIDSVCVSSKAVASGSNVEGRSNKRTRRRDNHSRGRRVTIADSRNMCANELGAKELDK